MLKYVEDEYFQGYGILEEAYGALTKDDILQSCISEYNFGSPKSGVDDVL